MVGRASCVAPCEQLACGCQLHSIPCCSSLALTFTQCAPAGGAGGCRPGGRPKGLTFFPASSSLRTPSLILTTEGVGGCRPSRRPGGLAFISCFTATLVQALRHFCLQYTGSTGSSRPGGRPGGSGAAADAGNRAGSQRCARLWRRQQCWRWQQCRRWRCGGDAVARGGGGAETRRRRHLWRAPRRD